MIVIFCFQNASPPGPRPAMNCRGWFSWTRMVHRLYNYCILPKASNSFSWIVCREECFYIINPLPAAGLFKAQQICTYVQYVQNKIQILQKSPTRSEYTVGKLKMSTFQNWLSLNSHIFLPWYISYWIFMKKIQTWISPPLMG